MQSTLNGAGIACFVVAALCFVWAFVGDWRDGNRGFFWGDVGERWMTAALVLMLAGGFLTSR